MNQSTQKIHYFETTIWNKAEEWELVPEVEMSQFWSALENVAIQKQVQLTKNMYPNALMEPKP